MPNQQNLTTPKKTKLLGIVGAVVGIVIVLVVYLLIQNAAAQPSRIDYLHFDNQRKILATSSKAYDPILEDYSARYKTAYMEDFPRDDKLDTARQYDGLFDSEMQLTEERLAAMDTSLVLKNKKVQTAYEDFTKRQQALLDYYAQYKSTITEIVEAVGEPCKKVTRLDPGEDDYAKNFVNASDKCLDTLASAKQHTTPSAAAMITELEKMYKTRQDAFKKVVNEKDDTARTLALTAALVPLLTLNSELADIQSDYQAAELKAYDKVKKAADTSNESLHKVVKQMADDTSSQSEEV